MNIEAENIPAEKMVETPSGKGASDENFPVGSFLLPRHLRPHVATFYAFARAIDDVADNPELVAADKVARLECFGRAILGEMDDPAYAKAVAMRQSLIETGVTTDHCCDLISAFKQDAVKNRYADWDQLIDYCMRSAAPVGRYLLDLHGESRNAWPYSDALCNALQVINHMQDCADDFRTLDRVYLPDDWMQAAGVTLDDLTDDACSDGMRRVLDRCLGGAGEMIRLARMLPGELESRSLAMETGVIIAIAERLTRMLGQQDPIAGRVELNKPQFLTSAAKGVLRTLFGG